MAMVAAPMDSGECTDTPSASTVHGELPRSECTSSPSPVPNSHRPTISRSRRAGVGTHNEARAGAGAGKTTASLPD